MSDHFPRLKRTIMGGPGNRSSIIDCSCGARFDGVYEYLGHGRRMCDWYARHAGIVGGGDAVARILHQYDEALDIVRYPDLLQMQGKTVTGQYDEALNIVRYPDLPQIQGKTVTDPKEILAMLRVS